MASEPVTFQDWHSSYYIEKDNMFYATGMIGATCGPNPKGGLIENIYHLRFPDVDERYAPPHLFTIGISLINPWGDHLGDGDTVCADICRIGPMTPDMGEGMVQHGATKWEWDFQNGKNRQYPDPASTSKDMTFGGGYQDDNNQRLKNQGKARRGIPYNACLTCWIGIPQPDPEPLNPKMAGQRIVSFRVREWSEIDVVATYSVVPLKPVSSPR